ncbi:DUF1670 domain-containing protein [Candidatus Poribacteria bacterium]
MTIHDIPFGYFCDRLSNRKYIICRCKTSFYFSARPRDSTHKREIITFYLQGCLTPTIAKKTRHSKDAVDRYIRDYEAVKLVRTATADIDKISQITHLSKRVICQYLDLIPSDELHSIELNESKSLAPESVEKRPLDHQ